MVNIRKAAGWAVVASLCVSCVFVVMLLIPALKAKSADAQRPGEPSQGEVLALKHEVRRLQRLLTEREQPEQDKARITSIDTDLALRTEGKANEIVIDLHKLLGLRAYYEGISFDVHHCAVPLDKAFPGLTQEQFDYVLDKFKNQLVAAMSEVLGKKVQPSSSWQEELTAPGMDKTTAMNLVVADPRTSVWRDKLTNVMSRFMLTSNKRSFMLCPEAQNERTLEDLGKSPCPTLLEHEVVEQTGYHSVPFISLEVLAHDALKWGVCTKDPRMKGSFGQWIKQERMFNDQWKTFKTPSLEEDAVVFMFDMLYERTAAFKQQYWLGSIMMQNPFDMVAITDIIHQVKPDLIIETGTANGGSALLWASIMHLNNIENGRVLTVDTVAPNWDPNAQHWGGVVRSDATQHPLWKKHVTFIQGSSVSNDVYQQILEAVSTAENVLVLLDSHHALHHVRREVELYCPFVTVNSYCIIEDTKLSRFASDGPLAAGIAYTKRYPDDFMVDRAPEPLFTHHAQGYIKRKAIVDSMPMTHVGVQKNENE